MPPLDSAFKNRNNYDRFHEFPLLDIATEGLNSAHSTDTLCSAFPSRTLSVGGAVMLSTTEIIVIGVIFGMVLLALMGALLYLWFKRT